MLLTYAAATYSCCHMLLTHAAAHELFEGSRVRNYRIVVAVQDPANKHTPVQCHSPQLIKCRQPAVVAAAKLLAIKPPCMHACMCKQGSLGSMPAGSSRISCAVSSVKKKKKNCYHQ
jgi:hypothetical protein